ncbi:MAG TPA: hypothetical protein VEM40_03430 [Nitrospirota bacterium]|nr:hypothetical protein [Nitrospirota bacterium]
MKTIVKMLIAVLILCTGAPLLANAVSWSPSEIEREEKAAKGIMEKSAVVCLFQSGTADVKKEIHVNDILIVYRESRSHQLQEVGKIRVLTYVGEDYLKGEVVEGEVKAGDIAKKGDVASLIITESEICK